LIPLAGAGWQFSDFNRIPVFYLNHDHDTDLKIDPDQSGSGFHFSIGSRFFRQNRSAILFFKPDRD